jgi:hypothetical protein
MHITHRAVGLRNAARTIVFTAMLAACEMDLMASTDVSTNAPGDGIPDGLCDVWQNYFDAWGLDPLADSDGDGVSNAAESIAGSDPRDPMDGFKTAGVQIVGDSVAFTFVAEKGKKYRVCTSDIPGGSAWVPLAGSTFVSTMNHANEIITVPRTSQPGGRFFRLEVEENDADSDGVSDWAEWRRGTDVETLAEITGVFSTAPADRAIFAESFSHGMRFGSDRMAVQSGFVSALPGESWAQITYFFDDPPDVRDGDIVVYWAFKSDASPGPEWSKLYMYLNFTDVPVLTYPEPARVALNVRPAAWCALYCDPGWQLPNDPELAIDPPVATFPNPQVVEKFRVIVHWAGGDSVTVTPALWNRAAGTWQAFTPHDHPELGPAMMNLSIATHLFGNTVFKSLFFQAYSSYPQLDAVLVTVRPRE